MKVGLLSDTHGYLDAVIFKHFGHVDEIWHAGDLGDNVINQLQHFKPLKAVFGNIDSLTLQRNLPEDCWMEVEGVQVWMTHIGGSPPRYNPRVKKLLETKKPHLFICGHSHILKVIKDAKHEDMLYINPGAAGNHGFHHIKTIMRLELVSQAIKNVEVIELGKRGALR